jgi:hypothetical protein
MNKVRRTFEVLSMTALFCLCVAVCHAGPAALDGSTPLVCTFTVAAECDSRNACEAATPEDLVLPRLFRVDFANKRLVAAGPVMEGMKLETEIKNYERRDGRLVLQGIDLRAWSMVITESTGEMTLTASGDDEAFVLFGACMAP